MGAPLPIVGPRPAVADAQVDVGVLAGDLLEVLAHDVLAGVPQAVEEPGLAA